MRIEAPATGRPSRSTRRPVIGHIVADQPDRPILGHLAGERLGPGRAEARRPGDDRGPAPAVRVIRVRVRAAFRIDDRQAEAAIGVGGDAVDLLPVRIATIGTDAAASIPRRGDSRTGDRTAVLVDDAALHRDSRLRLDGIGGRRLAIVGGRRRPWFRLIRAEVPAPTADAEEAREDRSRQARQQGRGDGSPAGPGRERSRGIEEPRDPPRQQRTQRDHPDSRRRQRGQPAPGQLEQVAGISAPVRAECDDEIVADLLGRLLDPPRQHPEQRLYPQRRRGQLPEQVPQPVAAAQMRQFVDEGIAQVLLRVLRQQDGRPAQAVQARTRQEGRTKDPGEPQSHPPG